MKLALLRPFELPKVGIGSDLNRCLPTTQIFINLDCEVSAIRRTGSLAAR